MKIKELVWQNMQANQQIRLRSGISLVEILVASFIMAAIVIPLLSLFQSGIETTKATIREVQGANLAAEISEQLDAIPFKCLKKLCSAGTTLFSSTDDSLSDMTPIDANNGYYFHVSPLLSGFERSVDLNILESDIIIISTTVSWKVNSKRDRTILVKRCSADDGIVITN